MMRRSLLWLLVALLVGSWLGGAFAAMPLAAAERGAMGVVRYDQGDLVMLRRGSGAVATYVAPPPQAGYLRAQAATFEVEYRDFPPEARAAFQQAVDIWQSLLVSTVPIRVVASWRALDEEQLGGAAPVGAFSDFAGAPLPEVLYPSSLANQLAGSDLAPDQPDITAIFNSTLTDWYFGVGQTPPNRVSFVSTVIHELGHGLGFAGTARVANGWGQWGSRGLPGTYDNFVENGSGVSILDRSQFPNPSVALAQQLQNNNLFWNGGTAGAANDGDRPKLFAPGQWQQGSSYSHLDEQTYPAGTANSLMTPALAPGESVYNPGPIALGMLADIGWRIVGGPGARACFQETGKCIEGRFAQYWAANGGLTQQGFPLTDEFDEVSPTDGKTYRVQYFERARFEHHPENAPPFDVLLGLLGREQLQAKYQNAVPATLPGDPLGTECATFGQTGKRVCGRFLQYWRANGGLAQQGFPLTDLFLETNPTDGKQYPTQYFERARFEVHPENAPPFDVLLGLLGREQFKVKYPGGIAGGPSPSPSASTSPAPPAGWGPTLAPLAGGQTYADAGGQFTVSLPGSWEVAEAETGSVVFGPTSAPALCTAGSESVTARTTLAVLDAEIDALNRGLIDYQLISRDQVVVRGVPAYRRVISHALEGSTQVREAQVYFVVRGAAAFVACSTPTSQFAGYSATFDGIAGSMKLFTMALVGATEAGQ